MRNNMHGNGNGNDRYSNAWELISIEHCGVAVAYNLSTGWPKIGTIFVRLNFTKTLTDFQNYVTVRIRKNLY